MSKNELLLLLVSMKRRGLYLGSIVINGRLYSENLGKAGIPLPLVEELQKLSFVEDGQMDHD